MRLFDGLAAYYSPGPPGGGMEKAEMALKHAAELFKYYSPKSALKPDWRHEWPYLWLARIATSRGDMEQARRYRDLAEQARKVQASTEKSTGPVNGAMNVDID